MSYTSLSKMNCKGEMKRFLLFFVLIAQLVPFVSSHGTSAADIAAHAAKDAAAAQAAADAAWAHAAKKALKAEQAQKEVDAQRAAADAARDAYRAALAAANTPPQPVAPAAAALVPTATVNALISELSAGKEQIASLNIKVANMASTMAIMSEQAYIASRLNEFKGMPTSIQVANGVTSIIVFVTDSANTAVKTANAQVLAGQVVQGQVVQGQVVQGQVVTASAQVAQAQVAQAQVVTAQPQPTVAVLAAAAAPASPPAPTAAANVLSGTVVDNVLVVAQPAQVTPPPTVQSYVAQQFGAGVSSSMAVVNGASTLYVYVQPTPGPVAQVHNNQAQNYQAVAPSAQNYQAQPAPPPAQQSQNYQAQPAPPAQPQPQPPAPAQPPNYQAAPPVPETNNMAYETVAPPAPSATPYVNNAAPPASPYVANSPNSPNSPSGPSGPSTSAKISSNAVLVPDDQLVDAPAAPYPTAAPQPVDSAMKLADVDLSEMEPFLEISTTTTLTSTTSARPSRTGSVAAIKNVDLDLDELSLGKVTVTAYSSLYHLPTAKAEMYERIATSKSSEMQRSFARRSESWNIVFMLFLVCL